MLEYYPRLDLFQAVSCLPISPHGPICSLPWTAGLQSSFCLGRFPPVCILTGHFRLQPERSSSYSQSFSKVIQLLPDNITGVGIVYAYVCMEIEAAKCIIWGYTPDLASEIYTLYLPLNMLLHL